MGARIINASWVTTNASAGLELAVAKALEGGVLIVAGAGNDSADIDRVPYYPASLPFVNILCIAPAEKATLTVTVNHEARGLPEGRHLNRIEFLLRPDDQCLQVLWTLDIYRACLLRISRPDPIGTPLALSLTGHPDATYVVEASPNLKSWGALATNTLPSNGELPCFCTVPRTARLQYYRACVVSPP